MDFVSEHPTKSKFIKKEEEIQQKPIEVNFKINIIY